MATGKLNAHVKPRPVLFHAVLVANYVWHVVLGQEVWVPRWAFKVDVKAEKVPE